jgi:ankyrin repeat protein
MVVRFARLFICGLLVFSVTNSFSQEIFRAVMTGDLNRTKTLLEEHPEWINATSWGNWTLLHRASQNGHKDIVDFLISKGADLEARTTLGQTPLYAAIYQQKEVTVKQLIEKGADVFAVRNDGETMLHIAAAIGNESIVKLLIAEGLNINIKRRYGITPLHLASVFGHKAVVEILISKGAETNVKNDNGRTPLHLAAASGEMHIVALLTEKGAENKPEDYPKITGEYLGQKKPGSTPELFAPSILLNVHRPHGSIAFSPDGREIYWAAALTYGTYQKIWMIRQVNGQWNPPKAAPFFDKYTFDKYTLGAPVFSPNGERFFVDVGKPAGKNNQYRDYDIWFLEKNSHGWSDLINPGAPLNSDKFELGPSISSDGTVYFYSSNIEGGYGAVDIYRSKFTNGRYEKPENLGDSINAESMDVAPYIAPDESYLLFSSFRSDGYGDFDIYVSYKKEDGTWTKAKNLGEKINTPSRESTSVVSPDGKFLFFMSRRNGIGEFFWVDAKVIEDLKPDELK